MSAVEKWLDGIERLAFSMQPPNTFTPHIVQLCIAARRDLRKELDHSGWYRIDDPENPAPKDGTCVLIADTDVWMAVARFWPCNMHWVDDAVGARLNEPTHWRPLLPPPPSEEIET